MTIGEFLKAYRRHYKFSVKRMAGIIGVNQYRLQKWEDGAARPKYEDSEIIKNFFGLPAIDQISDNFLAEILQRPTHADGSIVFASNDVWVEIKQRDLDLKDRAIAELTQKLSELQERLEEYEKNASRKRTAPKK